MRVKAVMEELSGEKIDIVPNSDDLADVIKRALTPADVLSVEVDEDEEKAIAHIREGDRARAVGRGGVNVNLASELTGYRISIEEVPGTAIVEEGKEEDLSESESKGE